MQAKQVDILRKRKRDGVLFILLLVAVTLISMVITEYDVVKSFTSIQKAVVWSASNFYPDAKAMAKLPDILLKLQETVLISLASTTVAAVFAIILALMGSSTTRVNSALSLLSRAIASVFRNIPVVSWGMVLVIAFGQSSLTGYFALFFISLGFLTRAFMETIDEVGESLVEALKATGAGYFHIVFQAVLPASMPQIISWLLYNIETNIRNATLVGILTGTGIGFSFDIYYKSLNYHAASLVVILIVITVLAIEYVSNYVRKVVL
ncbi:MAG: PhnE/PtxC family ABC transporter permease [Desulfitobacterium sp.]